MAVAKKNKSKRSTQRKNFYLTILLSVVGVSLVLGIGFYFYNKEKNKLNASFAGIMGQAKIWVAEKSAHKNQKTRIASPKKPIEPQIHYEFYTSLPSMQIPHPEKIEDSKKKSLFSNSKELEQDVSAHIKQGNKKPTV